MSDAEHLEKRRASRRATEWKATCRLRIGLLGGMILDITPHGAFFAPSGTLEAAELSQRLSLTEKVALRLDEPSLVGLELPARIRWIGYSKIHGRVGFGVQFSHLPMG